MGAEGVIRTAFWLPVGDSARAAWLHWPTGSRRAGGVVICPPIGFEYTHSHRTLRAVADRLAESGIPALRIDYLGTGDSPDDSSRPGLVDAWIEDILAAASAVSELAGDGPVTIVGLRLGGTLAALAAARGASRYLLAWSPVVRGTRYVRERITISRVAGGDPDSTLEAGGFVLSPATIEGLRAIDLVDLDFGRLDEVLLLERDDLPAKAALPRALAGEGVAHDVRLAAGYQQMMAEPQDTEVPHSAVNDIVAWIGDRSPEMPSRPVPDLPGPASLLVSDEKNGVVEEWIRTDHSPPLVGVLTRPAVPSGTGEARPTLLLGNSGSVHHVGPNRVYVEVARALAALGYSTVRFDLRNLGESADPRGGDENHPYPDSAVEDIRRMIEWLRREKGKERVVVAGICSGGHAAFHAALAVADESFVGVVPINPLTFYWEPGMSLAIPSAEQMARDAGHYKQSLRDPAKWRRLARGESDIRYITGFVARWGRDRVRVGVASVLEWTGVRSRPRLARDLLAVTDRGRRVHFVFSRSDPGYDLLRAEAHGMVGKLRRRGRLDVSFVEDADHTFSRSEWRSELIDRLAEALDLM